MIFANATMGWVSGDTVFRLFIPSQHRIDKGTSDVTQAKPAFWMNVGVPAGILPKIQPLSLSSVTGSPPSAPKMPKVITSGMTICMVVTPKLPMPAFSPRAVPCSRFGKNVLMFDIELAKLPPPTPDHSAMSWNAQSGQSLCCSTMPVPIAGASSMAVVRKIVLRPPARRIRNDAGMRIVAPAMPAIAVSVKSSAWVNGYPALSICTVMIPHIPHTAKPHSSAGTDSARLR